MNKRGREHIRIEKNSYIEKGSSRGIYEEERSEREQKKEVAVLFQKHNRWSVLNKETNKLVKT